MLVKNHLLLTFLLVGCISHLMAEDIQQKNVTFYAGINPLALAAFLPDGAGTIGTVYGIISNQEFGISLCGGMNFANAHSLEIRFSTGPASLAIWDTQLQLGYIWYPLQHFINWDSGLSAGLMLRQFFWNNKITGYVTFNFTPEFLLGWRLKVKSLAFDVRAGWNLASATWSTIPHTKAATALTPFPYNFTFTTGIAWLF